MIDWKILLITTIFVFQKLKKMKFPSRSITSERWMDVILPQTIQYRDLFLNCIRCQEWWNVCFSSFKFYFGNYFLLGKLNVALLSELLALQNIYCSELADRFTGFSVYHYTDNMAVPNIVQVELKKPHLQDSGMEVKRTSSLQHAVLGSKSFDLAAFSLDFQYFVETLEYFNFFHSSGLYEQLLE